jgi:4-amino-4-deoxy-L-arabinose transferase-like glycosyltransferase
MIETRELLMRFNAKPRRTSSAQTTSILVGGSVMLAIWIVVTVSNNAAHTAAQQMLIVLLASVATALLYGLVRESRCRAQRETELAAEPSGKPNLLPSRQSSKR